MDPMHRRLVNELNLRGYSPSTVQCYLRAVQKLEAFAGRSIVDLGVHDVRRYLLLLAAERKVSFSTYNQVACALRFFYGKVLRKSAVVERIPYQKQKRRLPIVLSRGEIKALVQAPPSLKHRAVLMTLYAGGLRLSEALSLRVDDIDSASMRLRIRQGKGGKERYVMLSEHLLEMLREYWRTERPKGWLFPGRTPRGTLDPRMIQRVFARARKAAGITLPATPHSLRHSFATHLLENGTNLLYIQKLLGHRSVRTTTIYAQVVGEGPTSVASPLDQLGLS